MNMFNGSIPASLRRCNSLQVIEMGDNQLTGDISQSFGVTWVAFLGRTVLKQVTWAAFPRLGSKY
jgi:hypothetical protein